MRNVFPSEDRFPCPFDVLSFEFNRNSVSRRRKNYRLEAKHGSRRIERENTERKRRFNARYSFLGNRNRSILVVQVLLIETSSFYRRHLLRNPRKFREYATIFTNISSLIYQSSIECISIKCVTHSVFSKRKIHSSI